MVASAAPYIIMNAFINLACVSFSVNYSLPLAERLRENAYHESNALATTEAIAKTEIKAPAKEKNNESPESDDV